MKKMIALLLATAMVGSLAACGSGSSDTTTEPESSTEASTQTDSTDAAEETTGDDTAASGDAIKIGWIVQDMANESQSYSCRIAEEQAAQLGLDFTYYDQAGDAQKATDAISTCIAQGMDAIIINPADPQAVVPALMEAKDAGIVVGLFSSDLSEENQQYRDFFCGTNDTMAGEEAAQAVIDAFPDGCNVVEIGGQSGHDAQVKRHDGFEKGLEGSNITVLDSQNCDAWATEDAMAIMEDFIVKYGDQIDAVFCHWDNGATGVINALQNANMEDVYIMAVDGCAAGYDQVKAGTQAVCIGQSFSNMVAKSLECAQAAVNGESYEEINWIPLDIVTADNVDSLPYPEW